MRASILGLAFVLLVLSLPSAGETSADVSTEALALLGIEVPETLAETEQLEIRDGVVYSVHEGPYQITGPSNMEPVYEIQVLTVPFQIAQSTERIDYVSTSSPDFTTPEGIRVGMTMAEVRKQVGGELREEHGWGCYMELESGWRAGFDVSHMVGDWRSCKEQITPQSEVVFFYARY